MALSTITVFTADMSDRATIMVANGIGSARFEVDQDSVYYEGLQNWLSALYANADRV